MEYIQTSIALLSIQHLGCIGVNTNAVDILGIILLDLKVSSLCLVSVCLLKRSGHIL